MGAAGSESGAQKECFAMSRGEKGCRLVKDQALIGRVVDILTEFCGGDAGLKEISRDSH